MADRILVLAKRDAFSAQASTLASILFENRVRVFTGAVGDCLPPELEAESGGVLLSFLSPWVIPQRILDRTKVALNFHPGSIDFPGTGCYNFALYEEAATFGAVCHHMLAKVDTGEIVEERTFPILPSDTVESLKFRTMVTMLAMFHDICTLIATGAELPRAGRHWSRRAFTREEMEALKRVEPGMPADEIRRRIKATVYPGYDGPYVELGEDRFYAPVPERPAIA